MAAPEERPPGRALWAGSVAVTAVVVTVMLAARQLRPLVTAATFLVRTGDPMLSSVTWGRWVRAVTWVAIAIAVLVGLRLVAALGAWTAVVFEAVVLVLYGKPVPGFPDPWQLRLWPLLLATGAAVLLTVSVRGRAGLVTLRPIGRWLLGAAAAVTALSAMAVPLLGTYDGPVHADPTDSLLVPIFEIRSDVDNAVHGLAPVAGLLLVLAALGGVERGVRVRVYALIAVIVAAFVDLQLGTPFPFGTASIVPVPPHAVLLALLVVGPSAAFGAGLLLIRALGRERRPEPAS